MNAQEIENYLRQNIPLFDALGASVVSANAFGVRLAAPLERNRGHRHRIFGGNAAAMANLAGWTTVYAGLRDDGIDASVVAQDSTIEYRKPVDGDIEVVCPLPVAEEWTRFVDTLRKRGKSRIELGALIECHGMPAVQFTGRFVARLDDAPAAAD